MLIYNIKQQANLPTGIHSASYNNTSQSGSSSVTALFYADGTWEINRASSVILPSTNGTWESRAPSTPNNYQIQLTGTYTETGFGGTLSFKIDGTNYPIASGGTFNTGWVAFPPSGFKSISVVTTSSYGDEGEIQVDATVNIRDTAPTFATITSNFTISARYYGI